MNTLLTCQEIIEKFQRDYNCYDTEDSQISKFFAGKSIFITGGMGFLGKLLLEKVLRACPQVESIYMLARAKKGKDVHTRIDEIFNDVIFERLSKMQPTFRCKVVVIVGDVSLPGLGISVEDRQMIIDKVSIFIHGAATLRFTEKLPLAVSINVKGTIEMLNLARQAKQIDAFVYVSTAFSHSNRQEIDELVYDMPYDIDRIIQISTATPPEILDKITPDLLSDWPNTYTFTKAMAENCVKNSAAYLPTCIVRPAIVISTYNEPVKSWSDNMYGANGMALGIGLGLVRTIWINALNVAEMVPADYVVNCILAAAYNTAAERKSEVVVYNFVTSNQNQINWDKFLRLSKKIGPLIPSVHIIWVNMIFMTKSQLLHNIYRYLLHMVPAVFVDMGLLVSGRKPKIVDIYKKIHKFTDAMKYFSYTSFKFKKHNTARLFECLSPADKKLFCFDMSKLDWIDYYTTYYIGMRAYVLKEDLSTLSEAKKKYFRLRVAHATLQIFGVAIVFGVMYVIMMYLFNNILV